MKTGSARWEKTPVNPPDLHGCAHPGCRRFGPFGLGPPLQPQRWWCREHLPADYWTRK